MALKSSNSNSKTEAQSQLVEFYNRNGYVRVPNRKRRKKEPLTYRMGYEIRLVAQTKRELALMRRLLRTVGLKPGKPFAKANQWCQPIYGKSSIEQFKQWLDQFG